MAEYAALTDVQARLAGRTIDASSLPSSTQVEGWLDEAEAELNGTLISAGLPAPYDSAHAKTILGRWVTDYAEGRTRRAYASAGGDSTAQDGKDLIETWDRRLHDIVTPPGPSRYEAVLSAASASSSASSLRAANTDPDADDYIDAEFETGEVW
jgi:hypothetical protein